MGHLGCSNLPQVARVDEDEQHIDLPSKRVSFVLVCDILLETRPYPLPFN